MVVVNARIRTLHKHVHSVRVSKHNPRRMRLRLQMTPRKVLRDLFPVRNGRKLCPLRGNALNISMFWSCARCVPPSVGYCRANVVVIVCCYSPIRKLQSVPPRKGGRHLSQFFVVYGTSPRWCSVPVFDYHYSMFQLKLTPPMSRHVDSKHAGRDAKQIPQPSGAGAERWFLLEAGYAKKTTKDYKLAVTDFLNWCDEHDYDTSDYDELDEHLCDWMHEIYTDYDGNHYKQKVANAVNGVQMLLPRAKGKLLIANKCLKRWTKARPSVSYPPLTWDLAVTIAVQMIRAGFYQFAVATVLGFDCLLRISEFMKLRKSDVSDARDPRLGSEYRQMTISFRTTKTGPNQSCDVRIAAVKTILRDLVSRTKGDELLFPGGVRKYRDVFKACCRDLRLTASYVPHSLRHGGATRMYLMGESIDSILHRGRWRATESARRYIQSSKAIAIATTVPHHVQSLAVALVRDVVASFAQAQKHKRKR